ncbi:MAG TPA: hypothetical protein VFF21_07125 [Flavobacteriaceae bacterium]|nr:hypothetical protein [Flavobacteriaceae bacterium]
MKIFRVLAVVLFLLPLVGKAQDSIQVIQNTLDHQMTEVFDKSNSYQEYKVIKKVQLASLRKNIHDSIASLQQKIAAQQKDLSLQLATIDTLNSNLKRTEEDLRVSQEKEDGIVVFGMLTSKSTYNALMFSIIGILLLIGGFLFYRFLISHKIINSAELTIAEMEIEIEDYRRNSLEREQKLRRKLQDEINKNRKMK